LPAFFPSREGEVGKAGDPSLCSGGKAGEKGEQLILLNTTSDLRGTKILPCPWGRGVGGCVPQREESALRIKQPCPHCCYLLLGNQIWVEYQYFRVEKA